MPAEHDGCGRLRTWKSVPIWIVIYARTWAARLFPTFDKSPMLICHAWFIHGSGDWRKLENFPFTSASSR